MAESNSAGYTSRRIPYAEYQKLLESYRMQNQAPAAGMAAPQTQMPPVQQAPRIQQTPQMHAPIPQVPQMRTPPVQAPGMQMPQVQAPVMQTPMPQMQMPPMFQVPPVQNPTMQPPRMWQPQPPCPQAPTMQMPQMQQVQTPPMHSPVPQVTTVLPTLEQEEASDSLPQRGHSMDNAFCGNDDEVIPIPLAGREDGAREVMREEMEAVGRTVSEADRAEVTDDYPPNFSPQEEETLSASAPVQENVFLVEDLLRYEGTD